MNTDCTEMRRMIESSIGYALEPDERNEIERHCAACEACRAYRERLLQDDSLLTEFAAPRNESVRRVQEGAIKKVLAADRMPNGRSNRTVARLPKIAAIAAAAAAVIIAFLVIDLIRGAHNGPVPAFAAVQEKMQQCSTVTFKIRSWSFGQWTIREEGAMRPRLYRKDYGDSIFVTDLGQRGRSMELALYPAEKRAVIYHRKGSPEQHDCYIQKVPDAVDRLASWYKAEGFSFVRRERLNGVNTAVYEKCQNPEKRETQRMTAWVDLETQLPVRFEMVSPRRGPNSSTYPYGLGLRDFQSGNSRASSWIDVKPGEPCVINEDFRWNSSADTSLFSLVPPSGYRIEYRDFLSKWYGTNADSCAAEGHRIIDRLASSFSNWLSLSGNAFPDDLADFTDSTKVKPLLVAKYRRSGDPADEFRSAYRMAEEFLDNGYFSSKWQDELQIEIHYTGKGATFGDSKRIVCWLKDENEPPCPGRSGNGPYFMIYGDLRIADFPTLPKAARE